MEQIELSVHPRGVVGKKVRFLRRQGVTPVHLFGHNVESLALQCDVAQLGQVLAQAGTSNLIDLKLDTAKRPRKVVVREVQRDPRTDELLHVDFYQVSMKEKIRMDIPIVIFGEAPALKLKENFLAHELNSLSVECLPDELPTSVELDTSSLTEAEQAIRVRDITLGEGVTILNNPEQMVVKISLRHVEKVVEEVAEEEAEAPEEEELEGKPGGETATDS